MFPFDLFYTATCNNYTSLFIHVQFGPDRQKPYSTNNYGALYYEVVSSPFLILKNYLDIIGKVILNQCDKVLLPDLFKDEDESQCRECAVCLPSNCLSQKKQKIRQFVYISKVRLIKRLVVTACQTVDSHPIIHCYETYTLCKYYHNPYLTIDL